MRTFRTKLVEALAVLEAEDQLANNADLNQLATQLTGDAAASGRTGQQPQSPNQKNPGQQQRADQLYQQYQRAKQDADKAEQEAAAKQDVGLFNKSASARKRMEDAYKAYQLAQQQALGTTNPAGTNGMPPEAATSAVVREGHHAERDVAAAANLDLPIFLDLLEDDRIGPNEVIDRIRMMVEEAARRLLVSMQQTDEFRSDLNSLYNDLVVLTDHVTAAYGWGYIGLEGIIDRFGTMIDRVRIVANRQDHDGPYLVNHHLRQFTNDAGHLLGRLRDMEFLR